MFQTFLNKFSIRCWRNECRLCKELTPVQCPVSAVDSLFLSVHHVLHGFLAVEMSLRLRWCGVADSRFVETTRRATENVQNLKAKNIIATKSTQSLKKCFNKILTTPLRLASQTIVSSLRENVMFQTIYNTFSGEMHANYVKIAVTNPNPNPNHTLINQYIDFILRYGQRYNYRKSQTFT